MRRAAAISIVAPLGHAPRQFDQPVEIGAHHAVFAGRLRHALQPAQFLARLILDLLGHLRLGDGLAEFGDLRRLALVALAQLALDRGHLLAQQHLAIARVERGLGLAPDLLRQPQHLDAVREDARDPVHPRRDVDRLQDFLLLVRRRVHVGRDHVRQHRPAIRPTGSPPAVRAAPAARAAGLDGLPLEENETRLDVGRRRLRLRDPQDARDEERPAGQEFDDLEPLLALADQMMRAVRRGDVAGDVGDRPHAVHVDRQRIGGLGVALHQDADRPLIPHRLLRGSKRARTADRDRQHDAGKQHDASHRHDDERVRRQRRQRRRHPGRRRTRRRDTGRRHANEPFHRGALNRIFNHGYSPLFAM